MHSLRRRIVLSWCAALALAGCASAKVTSRDAYQGGPLPRPERIVVHDFAASQADIPPGSTLMAASAPAAPMTPAEIETGRKLGAEVASELVARIQAMGLPAVRAEGQPPPAPGDLVIMGYFLSVDPGSAGKRLMLGFGSGAAELRTEVEGFQMTEAGLRRLGRGEVDSGSGKMPGMIAPIAVTAATHNPIGLVVMGGVKLHERATGADTIEGAAERTADAIAAQIRPQFEKQGWI
jgi:hypothetical protein